MIPHNRFWNVALPISLTALCYLGGIAAVAGEMLQSSSLLYSGLATILVAGGTFKHVFSLTRIHDGISQDANQSHH